MNYWGLQDKIRVNMNIKNTLVKALAVFTISAVSLCALCACGKKSYKDGTQNGEVANEGFYTRAQRALAGSREYARLLVETQDYHSIDAISGATISYGQFMKAVDNALAQAEG